jgi:uncharacterized protein
MKKAAFVMLTALAVNLSSFSQSLPEKPVPPRLVNDYVGFLTADEQSRLESKLVEFDRKTSTQIAVVILNSLDGYPVSEYAALLGKKWGVGQGDFNNGFILLIKPKQQNEKGEVAIATGYGVEEFVPDAIGKRIIEVEILPSFREGKYYEGIDKAVDRLISLTEGEFAAEEYNKSTRAEGKGMGIGIFIFILLLVFIFSRVGRSRAYTPGRSLPFWAFLALMGSMKGSHKGQWNDFSSGRGSFGGFGGFGGGGGGGFGGFGGGSFGGGGASGSW